MNLLLIDDEPRQREMLGSYLAKRGHAVREAGSAEEALDLLRAAPPDLVLTDVRLPGRDGVELIRTARGEGITAPFVVITAFGTIENAVAAMRAGAFEYLTKPIQLDDLDRTLDRCGVRAAPPARDELDGLGPAMRDLCSLVDRVAPSEATVLVIGESGTGKELVARRLHARSNRADGPLLTINCAALPDNLLEAELFGHEAGAFTGAGQRKAGLFEAARGGTILLDEIGDVSAALQVRLLRVIQEREVLRLGARQPEPIDVRIVAATHHDLPSLVREGRFREDLYYRLRVVEVRVPPLRERPEDVPVLADRLLARLAERNAVPPRRLARTALARLTAYRFPGNVRELEHLLERALLLAEGEAIGDSDLMLEGDEAADPPRNLKQAVQALERTWIRDALRQAGGVCARAARLLGIPDRVLRYKMRNYGIERP